MGQRLAPVAIRLSPVPSAHRHEKRRASKCPRSRLFAIKKRTRTFSLFRYGNTPTEGEHFLGEVDNEQAGRVQHDIALTGKPSPLLPFLGRRYDYSRMRFTS